MFYTTPFEIAFNLRYFFFMQKNRERIMKETGLQSKDIGELGRKMGEAWKAVS